MLKKTTGSCWLRRVLTAAGQSGWMGGSQSIVSRRGEKEIKRGKVKCRAKGLIAVLDNSKHSHPVSPYRIYKIFVLCDMIDGSFEKNIKTEGIGSFSLNDCRPLFCKQDYRRADCHVL